MQLLTLQHFLVERVVLRDEILELFLIHRARALLLNASRCGLICLLLLSVERLEVHFQVAPGLGHEAEVSH